MGPVCEHDGVKFFVVVGSGGAVDDDGAEDALPRLQGVVRVVPGGAVLGGAPGVGVGLARLKEGLERCSVPGGGE